MQEQNIVEMKGMPSPPPGVILTCRVVLILLCEKIPSGEGEFDIWKKRVVGALSAPKKFIERVKAFKGEEIEEGVLKQVHKLIKNQLYEPDHIARVNYAASKLCLWSINIMEFNRTYQEVLPLRRALEKAREKMEQATRELEASKEEIERLNRQIECSKEQLEAAQTRIRTLEQDKEECERRQSTTERLVKDLSQEKRRWMEQVVSLKASNECIVQDMLLAAAFIVYMGPFVPNIRQRLIEAEWVPAIYGGPVPGKHPLHLLGDETMQAKWQSEGLPENLKSFENAAIIVNSRRIPLLLDPQYQGFKWIKGCQGSNLVVLQVGDKDLQENLRKKLKGGRVVLIEGLREKIPEVIKLLAHVEMHGPAQAQTVRLGPEELTVERGRIFLTSVLSNPQFEPQLYSDCTIVNFTVTEGGLEEELLAAVVNL